MVPRFKDRTNNLQARIIFAIKLSSNHMQTFWSRRVSGWYFIKLLILIREDGPPESITDPCDSYEAFNLGDNTKS